MAFLQEVEGCRAEGTDVGLRGPHLGGGSTVPVTVWAFTDCLVVAGASWLARRRMRVTGPGESPTPADIAAAYRKPTSLERDGLDRIAVDVGRGVQEWTFSGVDHVVFEYVDGKKFDLLVGRERTGLLLPLLREIYPGAVRDQRPVF